MISQFAQLYGSPLQHYPHWASGASQIVFVCLVWFHFGFMQAPLWTVASETPFCPSEFCILAGILLHLVPVFAIHQWRESNENQGLSFTRLTCFFFITILYYPRHTPAQFHINTIFASFPPLPLFPEPFLCPTYCLCSNLWPSFL